MQDSNRHTEDRSDASGLGTVDRRKFLTVAGAGATAALAGCSGGGGGGGGNGDGGGGGGGGDPIRIGGIYLLSGLAEQLGAGSAAAAEVAVDAINGRPSSNWGCPLP